MILANTTSLAFPRMFDASRNRVAVIEDNQSVVNRTRLLLLTEPSELYNNPNFGVGLKQHMWKYNTENTKAIVQDKIIQQLRLHEPSVDPDKTSFSDGLLMSGDPSNDAKQGHNEMKMTVGLSTIYQDKVEVDINE